MKDRLQAHIVFDFDGVIADSERLHLRSYQEILAPEGITMSNEDYFNRYLGYDDVGVFRAGQGGGGRCERGRRRVTVRQRRRRAPRARDARQTSVRSNAWGRYTKSGCRIPGKALALYGEWAELGERRQSALRALLRAAEKAGDALIAAEAALKLGTEIPELPADARFAWCYRAAVIYEERAAADDEAVRAYEAALALDPRSRPALAGLARAHYRGGQLEALAGVLLKQAASEPNPAGASALAVEAGRIYAFRLGRVDEALSATSRALSLDPANVAAIADHARLLGGSARGEELADALGSLGQALADPIDKAAAYRLQAEIAEWQLGRTRSAGRDRARRSRDERGAALGRCRDPYRAAASVPAGGPRRRAGGGRAGPPVRRAARPRRGRSLDLAWRLGIRSRRGELCARRSMSRRATGRCWTRR